MHIVEATLRQAWQRLFGPEITAFVVDDEAAEVLIYAVTYGDADWAMRATQRRKER